MKKILSLITLLHFYTFTLSSASAQTPEEIAHFQCIGRELATYMNGVITNPNTQGLAHVKLLSPAFSLTSRFTPILFEEMAKTAQFNRLDGFAGNLYTVDGNTAYAWYASVQDSAGKTWKQKLAVYSKPVAFTEFGDFDTAKFPIGHLNRSTLIQNMATVYNTTQSDSSVLSINYFNALKTNTSGGCQFCFHEHTPDELRTMTASNPGKAGVNSAVGLNASGDFAKQVAALGLRWTVEIINGPGDLNSVVQMLNNAPANIIPIIRLCVGNSCGFSQPASLAQFIKDLDSQISRTVYVLTGPNEPETEPWATPSCGSTSSTQPPQSPLSSGWKALIPVACSDYKSNFHYLRPYPGNPMRDPLIPRTKPDAESDPDKKYNTLTCGNSLSGQLLQDFDGYGDNGYYENLTVPGPGTEVYIHTWCDTRPGEANYICNTEDCTTGFKHGTINCYRTITMDFNINLNNTNLGILGNTQTDGPLPNVTKQNEYLSWYLSGPSTVDSRSTTDLGNDAGPVWKLLPAILKDKAQQAVRGSIGTEVHPRDNFKYQSSPITSMEDLAGEFIPYADKANKPPEIVDPVCPSVVPAGPATAGAKCTAPYVVIPKDAIPAGH